MRIGNEDAVVAGRQHRARETQHFLGLFALGQIHDIGNAAVQRSLQQCGAEVDGHLVSVGMQDGFLVGVAAPFREQLCQRMGIGGGRAGGCAVAPVETAFAQVLPGEPEHMQEGVVGLVHLAIGPPGHNADGVGVLEAAKARLAHEQALLVAHNAAHDLAADQQRRAPHEQQQPHAQGPEGGTHPARTFAQHQREPVLQLREFVVEALQAQQGCRHVCGWRAGMDQLAQLLGHPSELGHLGVALLPHGNGFLQVGDALEVEEKPDHGVHIVRVVGPLNEAPPCGLPVGRVLQQRQAGGLVPGADLHRIQVSPVVALIACVGVAYEVEHRVFLRLGPQTLGPHEGAHTIEYLRLQVIDALLCHGNQHQQHHDERDLAAQAAPPRRGSVQQISHARRSCGAALGRRVGCGAG